MKQLVKLKDMASYSKGSQINGDELIEGARYYYLNGGINPSGKWNEANCEANTIAISEGGNSCGYVNYMQDPFWCGAHCYFLYDTVDNTKYLYYALKSQQDRIMKLRSGACMPNIKKGDLGNFEFFFDDDKAVQEKVITVLSKLEDIIDLKKKELLSLDALIKSRFVEMFGNPVNNEKGFVKAPMGDYMTLLTDFSSNGSYKTLDSGVIMYDEPNYAWMVRTTDLESGDMGSIKYIDEQAYKLLAKSKIFGGEIIMNKIGSAGKIYLMPKTDMPASLGRNAFMFRYDDRINVKFLYYLLTSDYGQREIQQYVRGAVTKTITKNDARAVLIIVPPIEFQNEFEQFVEQVDKSKVAVKKALDQTHLLFDSLMQQYFG